ncbi:cytochrome P450 [Actinoplanes sp. NBRC 14428]|nr:cytochrome P450 [Actinoplanes sp. NBRC 14428]
MKECPVVEFDMLDPDFARDPYETMAEWQALGPVVYNSHHNQYLVTTHQACTQVLSDTQYFNSANVQAEMEKAFGGPTFLGIDGARHQRIRAIWAPGFERKAVEDRLAPQIQKIVDVHVDRFAERLRSGESLDAIAEMTRLIPTVFTAQILGVEEGVHKDFIEWGAATGAVLNARLDSSPQGQKIVAEGGAAVAALNAYIGSIIEKHRALGVSDETLMAQMAFDDFAPSMTDREMIANGTMLTLAANESTAQLMGLVLYALALHPDQRRALVADRSLVPAAIEEVHRWLTISQAVLRNACSDESEVEGFAIPNGSDVMNLLGCANRDPSRWEKPEAFDIFRPRRAHIGFSFGPHICLGIHVARVEMRIWLNRLLDKLPEWEFAGDIEFSNNFTLRGLQGMPIRAA